MRIYLDTSVINVHLFGGLSAVDAERFPPVEKLFELMNTRKTSAVISLYSIQEIFGFCKIVFSEDAGRISRISLSALFSEEFELAGLLTREERLRHRMLFRLPDPSDQPHAVSAYLNKCDAIVTYDRHFQKIKDVIPVHTPEEIIARFS